MAKPPSEMTLAELAQDMCTREDSLMHLTAKAEFNRRQLEAQLEATKTAKRNSNYMLASVIIAAVSAIAAAAAAIINYLTM
jgi:hypothetical protein